MFNCLTIKFSSCDIYLNFKTMPDIVSELGFCVIKTSNYIKLMRRQGIERVSLFLFQHLIVLLSLLLVLVLGVRLPVEFWHERLQSPTNKNR